MNSRILIIYEYQILYQILNEIRESLNFEITQSNSKDLKELKYDSKNNYLIVSKKKIEGIKNSLILENVPIKFEKLIEIINIKFLKNKFLDQSHIKIGEYDLDLNSRKISLGDKGLNLTERETNLIIFIKDEKNVTIKELLSLNNKIKLPEISMGMTNDYLDALEYGSTYLRIGTGIFGRRTN